MDYLSMLKSLDDCLDSEDLIVLKFLCQDVIRTSRMDNIRCPLDLFDALESCGALAADKLQLLAELLFEAQRIDLMKAVGITPDHLHVLTEDHGHELSAYRRMLHQLSEHMVSSDVRQLKHIMKHTQNIQRSRLEEASDAYTLFSLLERLEKISDKNVSCLLAFTDQMDEKGLSLIVSKYKEEYCEKASPTKDVSVQAGPTSSILQEKESNGMPEYTIRRGSKKGICLIINNDMFVPSIMQKGCKEDLKGPRRGSSIDAASLDEVFSSLGFDVHVVQNRTAAQLTHTMREFSKMDHSEYDLFVCCMLTHGEAGKIFGIDCLPVSIYDLLSRFKPKHCPSLENKPKVFFVQACQGGRCEDDSLESIPIADGPGAASVDSEDLEMDYSGKLSKVTNIPRQPDYFLGLATVPGFVSYRSKTKGSWYMQALCEQLRRHHNSTDLLSIVTLVNNRVMEKVQRSGSVMATQTPLPQYTLRKQIYLRTT